MSATKTNTTNSALILVLTAPLCVSALAADYPPPPGLYRPLAGSNGPSHWPQAGEDRQFRRDQVPPPGRFSPPAGEVVSSTTPPQYAPPQPPTRPPTHTGEPVRFEDRYHLNDSPRLVPGYAPPGEESGDKGGTASVDANTIARSPVSRYLDSNPARRPADAVDDKPPEETPVRPASRFAPPELDSPPPASPPAIGNPVAESYRPYPRATSPGGPTYADPGSGRFRPPSTEDVGRKGASAGAFVPNGNAAGVSEAPRLPRSAPPLDPRFSGYQGAYDSRFRPSGLAPGPGQRRQ